MYPRIPREPVEDHLGSVEYSLGVTGLYDSSFHKLDDSTMSFEYRLNNRLLQNRTSFVRQNIPT